MQNKKYTVKNFRTGKTIITSNPLSVVQYLQMKKPGILDISIDLYKAFNNSWRVII